MLYTELLRLWDEAVRAVDACDWRRALELAGTVAEPNCRTLFIEASAHLALQELEPALQVYIYIYIHICTAPFAYTSLT